MQPILAKLSFWSRGIRFYIALLIGLITLQIFWLAQSLYGGSNVATIRTQEYFAWASVVFLFIALSIGPVLKLWTNLSSKKLWFESRRMIGIGAAWFALLHVLVAYIGQFKAVNPLNLPTDYQRAFAVGLVALLILLAMAATSFDRAFTFMGAWWRRLHRLVYVAAILVLSHIFLIGVHASNIIVVTAVVIASIGLVLMQAYVVLIKNHSASRAQTIAVIIALVAVFSLAAYGYTKQSSNRPLGNSQSSYED